MIWLRVCLLTADEVNGFSKSLTALDHRLLHRAGTAKGLGPHAKGFLKPRAELKLLYRHSFHQPELCLQNSLILGYLYVQNRFNILNKGVGFWKMLAPKKDAESHGDKSDLFALCLRETNGDATTR